MDLEKYKKVGEFTLSSGKKSNVYYDLKEAMGEPEILNDVIQKIKTKWDLSNIDVIVGIEYGGVPLAVGLSLATNIPFAVLRKKAKEYGMGKRIEGYQRFGNAILLDDVKTTGGSIQKAKEYLTELGYNVIITEVAFTRDDLKI
jgi:orotate phosphoribosyltransferase